MNKLICLFSIGIITFLSSCEGPKSYIKSTPFISTTDDKGDVELTGTLGSTRIEGMASYSPINHLDIRTQLYAGTVGYCPEFSIGTYERKDWLRLGLYAGYGRGFLNQSKRKGTLNGSGNDDPIEHVYGTFDKFYVQPEIAFFVDENIQIGFVGRFSGVDYRHLRLSRTSFSGTNPRPEVNLYSGKPSGSVREGCVFLRYQVNGVSCTLFVGYAEDSFRSYIDYTQTIVSLSIGMRLNALDK